MATLTTRILETRKERVQTTLLLALGVPCSAQLGVLMGMAAILTREAIFIWLAVVLLTLFTVGWLASRLLPGTSSDFILELPPVRRPKLGSIVIKTVARLEWYLKERMTRWPLEQAERGNTLGYSQFPSQRFVGFLTSASQRSASVR